MTTLSLRQQARHAIAMGYGPSHIIKLANGEYYSLEGPFSTPHIGHALVLTDRASKALEFAAVIATVDCAPVTLITQTPVLDAHDINTHDITTTQTVTPN